MEQPDLILRSMHILNTASSHNHNGNTEEATASLVELGGLLATELGSALPKAPEKPEAPEQP